MTGGQLTLGFDDEDQRAMDIAVIHGGTGIYTVPAEVDRLLGVLGWPGTGDDRLLDPGAGNGEFLTGALRLLPLDRDDAAGAARRVRGYEFYPAAAADARAAVTAHLAGRGWSAAAAARAARLIVEERDFLLSPVPAGEFTVIAANPPYWRLANLPGSYRIDYEAAVEPHARADMLYAYLQRSADVVAPGGIIGAITADRWLLNDGSAELRRRLGRRFRVARARRLDPGSAFYRPKRRAAGTPPRVDPVAFVLTEGDGRALDGQPFRLEDLPDVDGVPLPDLAEIRLAPWLGPDGIFLVCDLARRRLPAGYLVPAVKPKDIRDGQARPGRWQAIVTTAAEPPPAVLAYLDGQLGRMPPRGRRSPRWLPPETFAGRLPLGHDAVLVPRISTRLRPVLLPAGVLPVNHDLVVVSGLPPRDLIRMLDDPLVQAQADVLSRRVDCGYRDYTAKLLRRLVIPRHLLTGTAGT